MKNLSKMLIVVYFSIYLQVEAQTSYKYDKLNRLEEVSYSGVKISYEYDKLGNITSKTVIGAEQFKIPLSQGWNLISSYYQPNSPDDMVSIFSSISDKVVLVKNNTGSAYIPQWEANDIGSWDVTQGYLVYMNEDAVLGIDGVEINPAQTQIILNKGWNIIAYLRNSELDCETAFAGLKENNLVIVKNNSGAAYIPQWEANEIGNLVPGQGYLIYILEDDVLNYPGYSVPADSVIIGSQIWKSKNLDVITYRNGDTIPQVNDPAEWANLKTGAWCHYNNDASNNSAYGKLYNWYAINDTRGLSPEGWHIPSDAEFTILSDYLGGESVAGGKMKETGYTHWLSPNEGATNSSGFSGLPGGYRSSNGYYYSIRYYGYWWSSTVYDDTYAWYIYLYYNYTDLSRDYNYKVCGFSVRCVRD
jgi:uncharacterized protein (TIGR02145 family)